MTRSELVSGLRRCKSRRQPRPGCQATRHAARRSRSPFTRCTGGRHRCCCRMSCWD